MSDTPAAPGAESLDAFRLRVREWLARQRATARRALVRDATATIPRWSRGSRAAAHAVRAGLAGLVFPREYGGQGLAPEYQRAVAEEAKDYEQAFIFQEPTLNILAPTLLDFGTEEQKRRHLPTILRGDERWVQFLSEPSSGSDARAR